MIVPPQMLFGYMSNAIILGILLSERDPRHAQKSSSVCGRLRAIRQAPQVPELEQQFLTMLCCGRAQCRKSWSERAWRSPRAAFGSSFALSALREVGNRMCSYRYCDSLQHRIGDCKKIAYAIFWVPWTGKTSYANYRNRVSRSSRSRQRAAPDKVMFRALLAGCGNVRDGISVSGCESCTAKE